MLIQDGGVVKSVKFKDHKYLGDPINAVKIFNEKEVDEIVILDISATAAKRPPDVARIKDIVSEAFMPLAYGGGITKMEEVDSLISSGVEKIILNTAATNASLIEEAAKLVGSQSIVISIDVKKNWLGQYKVYIAGGSKSTGLDPIDFARRVADAGAGEIVLQSVDNDRTFQGYDLGLKKRVSEQVSIPLVALGGAGSISDLRNAVEHGASAVAAGSMFVLQRPHRAVLISYPSQKELKEKVFK